MLVKVDYIVWYGGSLNRMLLEVLKLIYPGGWSKTCFNICGHGVC